MSLDLLLPGNRWRKHQWLRLSGRLRTFAAVQQSIYPECLCVCGVGGGGGGEGVGGSLTVIQENKRRPWGNMQID